MIVSYVICGTNDIFIFLDNCKFLMNHQNPKILRLPLRLLWTDTYQMVTTPYFNTWFLLIYMLTVIKKKLYADSTFCAHNVLLDNMSI